MPDQLLRVLSGHEYAINSIRFTKDGSYCMTASDDKTVKLWNPHRNAEGEEENAVPRALCIQTFAGVHGYSALDVAITNDKSRFASAGEDRQCFLWDVVRSQVIRRIQTHNQRTNSLDFNEDGSVLFTASYDKTVKCWDLKSQNRDPIQILTDFKDSVTFLRQIGHYIIASSVDGYVRSYDMRQGLMNADNLFDPVTCLSFSEDEKMYLATCLSNNNKSKLKLMEFSTGKSLKDYSGHRHQHYKIESCFENNYSSIVCGSEDGNLYHYHLLNGNIQDTTLNAHRKAISSLSYHPTMDVFVTASYDSEAKLWKRGI
jgi:mitogen-activated protein kinase organizer 1